jgi:hypothetical protein
MTVLRNVSFNLVNQDGDQLVDESGNELVANVQLNDFEVSAYDSKTILHGPQPAGFYDVGYYPFWLTDESGNLLVDESGNELIARINVGLRVMHAGHSVTMVHGG